MYDKTPVAFDSPRIVGVIVNPVAVERQSRISKEKRTVEMMGAAFRFISSGNRRRGALGIKLAINDVLPFRQCKTMPLAKVMADRNKAQRSAFPGLSGYSLDPALPLGLHPRQQRRVKYQPSRCPHPPWKTEIRNEIADFRVSITTKILRVFRRPEIELVIEWRQRAAMFHLRIPTKCRFHRRSAGGIKLVCFGLARHSGLVTCRLEGS